jgi:hypothetical protein
MPEASFLMPVDRHGRSPDALPPGGGTVTISINNSGSTGDYIPGNADVMRETDVILRVTATEDSYVAFGENTATANSSSMIFLKGTESMQLPSGCNYVAGRSISESSALLSVTVLGPGVS